MNFTRNFTEKLANNATVSYETDSDHCQDAVYSNYTISFSVALFFYSTIVFVLYSLLQRRKTLCQDCCYGGYCGLPVPLDFINETKDRWVYCAAFGMLVNLFTILVVLGVSQEGANDLTTAFGAAIGIFIGMMLLPLYFFALIASIHGPLEPLSHLIGFIYALLSFVAYVRPCAICMHHANSEPRGIEFLGTTTASQIVSCTPLLLCNGIVLLYFAVRGIYITILRVQKKPLPKQKGINHYLEYVTRLLRGLGLAVICMMLLALLTCLSSQADLTNSSKYFYKWDPYFKYSVRVLSVFTVIFIALFVLSVQGAFITAYLLHVLKHLLIDLSIEWTDVLEAVYKVLLAIGFVVPLVSFVLIIIPLMISLTTYRRNCKQLWRGDRSFIPKLKKKSPTTLLTSSAFLFGRQLAMAIWAWIFYMVILFVVLLLFTGLIVSMVFSKSTKEAVLGIIYSLLLTFGVSKVIYCCQLLFVHYTFADKSVLVDNRRLFHLYTFFFLFYNSLSGLLTTLRRIVTSFVVALFYLPRLDRPLVIAGLEFLDKGYASYLAYIQVEATYTNPVLNVFIHLLTEKIEVKLPTKTTRESLFSGIINLSGRHYGSTPLMDPNCASDDVIVNKVARRRWHLMYTLLRNPELIELRKGFVPRHDAAVWSS